MTYRITATAASITDALKIEQIKASMAMMRAMTRASDDLKSVLRDQVQRAGLSPRLALTWQGKVYPQGATSLSPAAYVYSKAPKIIDAFSRGATIVATGGRRCLALPTDDTPLKASGGRNKQSRPKSPAEVEAQFGRKLRFVPARSARGAKLSGATVGYLLMDNVVARKSTGRFRRATEREVAGTSRNAGRLVQSVVMFTLEARVKMPRLFDLQATADGIAATVPQMIAEEWK